MTRLQERLPLSSYRRPLLGTGLCGGLSTFSTMQVEILKMLSAHAWGLAAGYAAASMRPGTRRSTWPPRWSAECGCGDEHRVWIGVVLIGGAGSVVRFLADGMVSSAAGRDFPFGTMVVNVSGAVILGLLTGLALGHDQALLAGTAAVGSYTTFSTWMLETQRLTEERQHRKAVANVVVSLVLGVAAAALGRLIGAHLPVNADCLKLTSYFGERQRTGNAFVADALLDLYGRHEIATSVLLRGIEGFGAKHRPRTDRSLTLSEDLPLVAVAVDARPRIEAVLGEAPASPRAGWSPWSERGC